MAGMLFSGVAGIIADHLQELKSVIASQANHPTYAQRLELFSTRHSDLADPVIGE